MKKTIKPLVIAAVMLFVFGCSKKEKPQPPASVETPAPPASQTIAPAPSSQPSSGPFIPEKAIELPAAAPLTGLEWVKGSPVTFEPGKTYLVEFWATWCGPCKVSIPHLTELQKKYSGKNLTVIGISTPSEAPHEDIESVKSFVTNMGDTMAYTVAFDAQGLAEKNYMRAFNIQGIPHAFLIDGTGKIVWQGHPMDDLDAVLEQVVGGVFDPAAYAKQKAEARAREQQAMAWYTEYFKEIEADGLTDELRKIGAKFIEVAPVDGLNAFAWNILIQVKETNRDLEAALKAAEKANQLCEGKEPIVLDTYALALFENGKIQEAVQAQQQAVDMIKDNPPVQAQMLETLEKYKAAAEKK